ncbi:hypothetical protein EVAR_19273_1 [Eumeta japonica]|uniref:Uncharacterized protein n=1 Tax=Eumeta variegata TaxID=151549 RepID=A0A4C1UDE4_EUMVA|nr:hypothetical protein EVAR_19273_1 [Eumeta japonica]
MSWRPIPLRYAEACAAGRCRESTPSDPAALRRGVRCGPLPGVNCIGATSVRDTDLRPYRNDGRFQGVPLIDPRAAPGPSGEAVRREPPVSLPASATAGTTSFGDDIQTMMSILRAVKSSEISEFARDFRACSNVEEKLMVLVRYHHLMVKLESI